jgi:hypothetical protein
VAHAGLVMLQLRALLALRCLHDRAACGRSGGMVVAGDRRLTWRVARACTRCVLAAPQHAEPTPLPGARPSWAFSVSVCASTCLALAGAGPERRSRLRTAHASQLACPPQRHWSGAAAVAPFAPHSRLAQRRRAQARPERARTPSSCGSALRAPTAPHRRARRGLGQSYLLHLSPSKRRQRHSATRRGTASPDLCARASLSPPASRPFTRRPRRHGSCRRRR